MIEPEDQIPVSRRISRSEVDLDGPRYRKVGEHIGYEKTFPGDVWDDSNGWVDQHVWGGPNANI